MNFKERVIVRNTDAFRGSIAMNLVQSISNQRRCRFESTMSLFHCAEFTSNVVIYPWVRGREPSSNVFLQFVACEVVSSFECS